MDKIIIYARVSSKEQESEGYSIPAQIKLLEEMAFTDVETAKKAGRTQFGKMIEFIKENPSVKHVLVEKTDRLLRNISDYALHENSRNRKMAPPIGLSSQFFYRESRII
jgi:DNA invertase Pin-like site-specific DNA recombinase